MDVHIAFLQGKLDEKVYMNVLEGFDNQGEKNLVCILRKSLYGLKHTSRQWNVKLCNTFTKASCIQSNFDYSVFSKHDGDQLVVFLVYVDDLLISGNSSKLITELKHILESKFKMKDLGDSKYFLGIEIARSDKGIVVCQRKYA